MIVSYSVIFLVFAFISPAAFVFIPKHSHTRERVEDGAHSPRSHDPFDKKSESELHHEAILGTLLLVSHSTDLLYIVYFHFISFLGSAKEAEEFDHLSPEESKKRLRLLVTKIDANKDGFVDPDELYGWIMKSFK